MTESEKSLVTPDDQLIVVPPGKPKGWRIYSVQPAPSEERMEGAANELTSRGFKLDWWIQGRGVFLVDCRADLDDRVVSVLERALA